jgi:hypothetical protein
MSNTKNLANLAAALDDGTSGQVLQSTGSGGVQFADSTGSGVTVHANQAAMLTDAASASEGSLHYETNTNKLYVKQSSGFYLLASITNATPTIDSFSENTGGAGANNLTAGGTFTLTSGSNTVVTINATEPDLETISYSATVTSGTATNVFSSPSFPVTNQSSNVFTLTPVTSGTGGTVTIRFDASDGTNVANVSHSFEIAFIIADSHFTSLLMATDGSAGNNKDDISDATGNHTANLTITGDAHAGTFSPYRHGGYSLYNTSTNHIQTSGLTAPATGDYTIEAWIYVTDNSATSSIIWDTRLVSQDGTNGSYIIFTNSNKFTFGTGGATYFTTTSTYNTNEWLHVALVRDSSTARLYINGVLGGSTSNSTNWSSGDINIGSNRTGVSVFNGYIRDLRIANEVVYSGAFTPPTGSLTTTGGEYSDTTNVNTSLTTTQLLTCHLPYLADGSSNDRSITVTGSVETKPFGPYDYNEYSESINGGSVYFDGSDNLKISSSSDFAYGTGDFTVEFWFYYTGAVPTNNNSFFWLQSGTNPQISLMLRTTTLIPYAYAPTQGDVIVANTAITPNTWQHHAMVRQGSTLTLYLDGNSIGSTTYTSDISSSAQMNIGSTNNNIQWVIGSLTDFRVVKGTAVYTGNFTPPSGPLTTTGGTYPSTTNVDTSITSGHTKLLLKGTDAHVLDKSQSANLKLVGTAASTSALTSGSTPPYIGAAWANTSAVSFDGNSDYVRVPYESIPSFGVTEFTIEGWIYMNNLSASQLIVDKYASGNSQSFQIYYRSTGASLTFYVGSSILLQDPSSSTISAQTWHHFAVTRDSSGNVRLYVDGLKKAQSTSNVNFDSSIDLHLGAQGSTSTNYFNGYMQDVRLSNKAFYTADDHSASSSASIKIPSTPLKG